MNDSELYLDYLDRLVDALFSCDCQKCERERHDRLIADLRLAYGCNTPADFIAKKRREIN
ncbi:MAG TPA: hypothetical protein VMQ60_03100 [Acidobacteriaceae bacterium]|jgi:hypothetical protein|nr:hypothetical protein [Acidobacteriaceae bacterium]